MHIQIISVGTKPRPELQTLITTYSSRLPRSVQVDWTFIKHGSGDALTSMQQEAEKILKSIPQKAHIVLLDETGNQLSSVKFSERLFSSSKDTCFIIGGAYGVTDEVKKQADSVLSLSSLVLPHQLVRLVLIEQIYRAHCIATGHPYHHA